jgi:methylated-DNA-[protein]-cysteine S-methyltransferase
MKLFRTIVQTPVGPMVAVASEAAICALEFPLPGRISRLDRRLARWFAPHEVNERPNAVIERTRAWLASYFAGTSADADELPLEMRGAEFERRVWTALRTIPPGETTTYGAIAKQVGTPAAARAVGLANGANPIAIVVPCHRVVGANGALTGYGGGLDCKRWLINHERRWRNALPL